MDFLIKYNIELAPTRNAVPRITPCLDAQDDWLTLGHTKTYQEKLEKKYGRHVGRRLSKWLFFLRKNYQAHPTFVVKAIKAIFEMARQDEIFKTQNTSALRKSHTFLAALLKKDIDLSMSSFNPILRICPIHQLIRVALLVGKYYRGRIQKTVFPFHHLEIKISTVTVQRLFEELELENLDRYLALAYLKSTD